MTHPVNRLRYAIIATVVGVVALTLMSLFRGPVPAVAQTPQAGTPSPTPAISLTLRFDDRETYSWNPVEGAIGYTIRGNVYVIRTNAARPICSPPLVQDDRNVNVTANLGQETTSYRLTLPELPPEDRWFVASYSVALSAFDAANQVIASTMLGHIAETACPAPSVPTPLAEPIRVGNCDIPAGYLEVTTPAAQEHGQRVFEDATGVSRIYVRADASCVTLNGAMPPVPEFVRDGPLGVPAVPGGSPPPKLTLPGTGGGGRDSDHRTAFALALSAAGAACLALRWRAGRTGGA